MILIYRPTCTPTNLKGNEFRTTIDDYSEMRSTSRIFGTPVITAEQYLHNFGKFRYT